MSNAVILKLNDLGYSTVPGSVYEKIAEWKSKRRRASVRSSWTSC